MTNYGKFGEEIHRIVNEELDDHFTRADINSYIPEIERKFPNHNTVKYGIGFILKELIDMKIIERVEHGHYIKIIVPDNKNNPNLPEKRIDEVLNKKMEDVMILINKRFTEKIINGNKNIIFIKNINSRFRNARRVIVYESGSNKKMVGDFKLNEFDEDTPLNLWKKYSKDTAFSENQFFNYYKDKYNGVALKIDNLIKYKKPKDYYGPSPQNYRYIRFEKTKCPKCGSLEIRGEYGLTEVYCAKCEFVIHKKSNNLTKNKINILGNKIGKVYGKTMFKVGSDIESGEYTLIGINNSGHYSISKEIDGKIVKYSNFKDGRIYIKIESGQILSLENCEYEKE
jgi:predicted transcriptional regulator